MAVREDIASSAVGLMVFPSANLQSANLQYLDNTRSCILCYKGNYRHNCGRCRAIKFKIYEGCTQYVRVIFVSEGTTANTDSVSAVRQTHGAPSRSCHAQRIVARQTISPLFKCLLLHDWPRSTSVATRSSRVSVNLANPTRSAN